LGLDGEDAEPSQLFWNPNVIPGTYKYNSVKNTKIEKYKYTFNGTPKYTEIRVQLRTNPEYNHTSILVLKVRKKFIEIYQHGSTFENLDTWISEVKNGS
jgi:hypothetical protein